MLKIAKNLTMITFLCFSFIVAGKETFFNLKTFYIPSFKENALLQRLDFYFPVVISARLIPEKHQYKLKNPESKNKKVCKRIFTDKELKKILSAVKMWRFKVNQPCNILIKIWIGWPVSPPEKEQILKRKTKWHKMEITYNCNGYKHSEKFAILNEKSIKLIEEK